MIYKEHEQLINQSITQIVRSINILLSKVGWGCSLYPSQRLKKGNLTSTWKTNLSSVGMNNTKDYRLLSVTPVWACLFAKTLYAIYRPPLTIKWTGMHESRALITFEQHQKRYQLTTQGTLTYLSRLYIYHTFKIPFDSCKTRNKCTNFDSSRIIFLKCCLL